MREILIGLMILFLGLEVKAEEMESSTALKLSLEDCVEIALKNNPELLQAKSNFNLSQASYRSNWSALLPQVTGSARYNKIKASPYYDLSTTKTSTVSLGLNQSLFDLRDWAQVAKSNAEKNVALQDYKIIEARVILEVKERYYEVLKAQRLLNLAESLLRESEENLRKAEVLFNLGATTKIDLLKIQVERTQREFELITAQKNLKLAKVSLTLSLGMDSYAEIELQEDSLPLGDEVVSLDSLLNLAKTSRPEIQKARLKWQSTGAELLSAKWAYLPSLSFFSDYSYSEENWPEDYSDWRDKSSLSVGFDFGIPFFDGFLRESNLSGAKAKRRIAELDLKRTELKIAKEVREVYYEWEEIRKKLSLTRIGLEEARESYRLLKEKYALGVATSLELVSAQAALARAETSRIEAVYESKLVLARFERAIGK